MDNIQNTSYNLFVLLALNPIKGTNFNGPQDQTNEMKAVIFNELLRGRLGRVLKETRASLQVNQVV